MLTGTLLAAILGALGLECAASPVSSRAGGSRARVVPESHVVHESHEDRHTDGWMRSGRAYEEATLPMRIGLKQSNLERGHDLLMDISDPASPNYGKHLTAEEVIQFFAPHNSTYAAVRGWLIGAGIPESRISRSANLQWVQFDATVAEAEDLLLTDYHVYEHEESGLRNIACSGYHVPAAVQGHIDYITPGIRLMNAGYGEQAMKKAKRRRFEEKRQVASDIASVDLGMVDDTFADLGNCSANVTPWCIKSQYQIPIGTKARPGNELGIFQSLGQYYNQQDLDYFFSKLAPWVPNGSHPILRSINGGLGGTTNQNAAGSEADLDFQTAMPLIWPQKAILWSQDDEYYQREQTMPTTQYLGFFNTLFDAIDGSYCTLAAFGQTGNCVESDCRDPEYPDPYVDSGYQGQLMCGVYKPTKIISISYSGVEATLPYSYMQRQCLEILKLGLQGTTVIVSSGDHGVGGLKYDPRAGCLGPNKDVYSPRTMSNCPYVLSVGATLLTDDPSGRSGRFAETAPVGFASGGGFSNVFATPPWQRTHVDTYLRRTNAGLLGYVGGGTNYSNVGANPGKIFNMAGRGYPDVAAIGENQLVYTQGSATRMRGTSVAVPIWASILNLINEERLAVGKGPVGLVHQVLYGHPEAFTDVVVGSNPGCGSSGFAVKDGWDPVTGLGTPIYPKLLGLFMSLP